jgi:hypothetical protein
LWKLVDAAVDAKARDWQELRQFEQLFEQLFEPGANSGAAFWSCFRYTNTALWFRGIRARLFNCSEMLLFSCLSA